jgi:hypothetical protein
MIKDYDSISLSLLVRDEDAYAKKESEIIN